MVAKENQFLDQMAVPLKGVLHPKAVAADKKI